MKDIRMVNHGANAACMIGHSKAIQKKARLDQPLAISKIKIHLKPMTQKAPERSVQASGLNFLVCPENAHLTNSAPSHSSKRDQMFPGFNLSFASLESKLTQAMTNYDECPVSPRFGSLAEPSTAEKEVDEMLFSDSDSNDFTFNSEV